MAAAAATTGASSMIQGRAVPTVLSLLLRRDSRPPTLAHQRARQHSSSITPCTTTCSTARTNHKRWNLQWMTNHRFLFLPPGAPSSPSCYLIRRTSSRGVSGRWLHSNNSSNRKDSIVQQQQQQQNVQVLETRHASSSSTTTTRSAASSTSTTLDLERQRATKLVDQLLERTRQLMTEASESNNHPDNDQQNHHHHRHHVIAYSGGVDSSLVAALVHQNVGQLSSQQQHQHQQQDSHSAQAVLGVSPAVPDEQIDLARRVMEQHMTGMDFTTTPTHEGQHPLYVANTGQACWACKTELYTTLLAVHRHGTRRMRGVVELPEQSHTTVHLYNGTNADDLHDATRVGLMAAAQFRVQSPLMDTTKADVRVAARHVGLSHWHVAASPCLRSRLAFGVPATPSHLSRIAAAERFVRHALRTASLSSRMDETTNMRVRLLSNQRACLEIDDPLLEMAQTVYQQNRDEWDSYLLDQLDFASLGMRAFASGSVSSGGGDSVTVVSTPTKTPIRNTRSLSLSSSSAAAAATTTATQDNGKTDHPPEKTAVNPSSSEEAYAL